MMVTLELAEIPYDQAPADDGLTDFVGSVLLMLGLADE